MSERTRPPVELYPEQMQEAPAPEASATPMSPGILGVGRPRALRRKSSPIRHFEGGQGQNNCPRFWYLRGGFGCIYTCEYCYLQRFGFRKPEGAEYDPDVPRIVKAVSQWLKASEPRALICGEVEDAWGWAHIPEVHERNRALIELFRRQERHTLIFLTKSHRVLHHLEDVAPSPQVVLSWSVNASLVAELHEMGADQARKRLAEATRARAAGWRVRLRVDPMIPVRGWQASYAFLAHEIAFRVKPEQVTAGSWRPRPHDPMFRWTLGPLRDQLEKGPDGRYRLKNRLEMYELLFRGLQSHVPELALCKEELEVERALYAAMGIGCQACNCLGRSVVPVSARPLTPPPTYEV